MTESEKEDWEEICQEVEQQVANVPLAFTEVKNASLGLETCNQWLAELGRNQDVKLENAENGFENLLNRVRQMGIEGPEVPPFAPHIRQWNVCVQQACDQFLANLENSRQDIHNGQVQSQAFRHCRFVGAGVTTRIL